LVKAALDLRQEAEPFDRVFENGILRKPPNEFEDPLFRLRFGHRVKDSTPCVLGGGPHGDRCSAGVPLARP